MVLAGAHGALSADRYILNQNQTGLTLPGVNLPQGYDEIRTSDGTSCRSSNTGSGAYADVGVVGGGDNETDSMNTGAVYGRVVLPLGKNGTRLDCRRLYDLEIERLQAEVRLLKAGLGRSATSMANDPDFETGWSNKEAGEITGSVTKAPDSKAESPKGLVVPDHNGATPNKAVRRKGLRAPGASKLSAPPLSEEVVGMLRNALP